MIKEKDKKKKEPKKTIAQILSEYVRTVLVSFFVALVITIGLSIHAKDEMIKNMYISAEERHRLDEKIARQIIQNSDLMKDLPTKSYAVSMHVGSLYEAAGDYPNAQIAYESALSKAKRGVYPPYYKLSKVLIAQSKFDEADALIKSVTDVKDKGLIKFKTRAYIEMGDKYYSLGKFVKAARNYETAQYYYNRFSKKDAAIEESIHTRILNAYSDAATEIVKQGFNTEAAQMLHRAEKYAPKDFHIKYKLAIIYSDLDPVKSVEYFEPLLKKMPQYIDYSTYNKALLKAATIAELEGNYTQAKCYRYKSHSIDLLINNKVVYKNDVDIYIKSFKIRKFLFRYHLTGNFVIKNVSGENIYKMFVEFQLKDRDKLKEQYTQQCVSKKDPLISNGGETEPITVKFGRNIFTRKELSNYGIDVYLYKDERYKTYIGTFPIPAKSIKNATVDLPVNPFN